MTDLSDAAARFKSITGCDEFPPTSFSWAAWEERLAQLAPAERRRLGVYTTPAPLVDGVVADVERQLREGFLLEGLADETTWAQMVADGRVERPPGFCWDDVKDQPFVRVLDPACGTGVFPAAALRRAGPRLASRLHGVEIDPVAWGLCHAAVAPHRPHLRLGSGLDPWAPELPVTVVLGNPPWSGISENRGWIVELLRGGVDEVSYYHVDGQPLGERKLWLQDDYVKFVRRAQHYIDRAGAGVVGYVTNHGWLDNPTFRGMRAALLRTFPTMCVVDLGGSANRARAAGDENIFGIRQGVAALTMATHGDGRVRMGTLAGAADRKLRAVEAGLRAQCRHVIVPCSPRYELRVAAPSDASYSRFTPLTALFPVHTTGLVTARDHFVVGFTRDEVLERIRRFRDPGVSDAALRAEFFSGRGASKYPDGDTRSWKLGVARARVRGDDHWAERVRPYYYRALDVRWVYAAPWMIDWGRPDVARHLDTWFGPEAQPPDLWSTAGASNLAIVWMRQVSTGGGFSHVLVSRQPVDNRCMRSSRGIVSFAPLMVSGRSNVALDGVDPMDALGFAYATLWSPAFRARHQDDLCREVPRVPLDRFDPDVARFGRRLIALHLGESAPVGGGDAEPMGGVDPAARYRKACARGGRAVRSEEVERAAWIEAVAATTRRWIHAELKNGV